MTDRKTALWFAIVLLCWLGLWALVSGLNVVGGKFLSSPVEVLEAFLRLAENGYAGSSLSGHFLASFMRTMLGFGLAIVIGVPVGLLMGMSRLAYLVFSPIFSVLRPIPTIAFIPLVILWFGIGEISKVLVIFVSAFLFIVLNTYQGVLQIPAGYKRVAENNGASPGQMFWRVILPAAAPSILTGIKVGLAIAWAVVVAAELIAAQQGLGFMIMDAATFFRIPIVYIGVLSIGLVGFLLEGAITLIENRLVHWRGR
jgi:NitT/TauT family transport system permease protein